MMATYPAVYRDAHGEAQAVIENDGQTLRMVVRGVEFISKAFGSFDMLTAQNVEAAGQASFMLDRYDDLLAATIVFDVPLTVAEDDREMTATLTVEINLEGAGPKAPDRPWADPILVLNYGNSSYSSASYGGSFEAALLNIQRQLPNKTYMKCCFNCAFSGYNPSGEGLWGMFCHRNHKLEYLQANNKPEWFRLSFTAAERVQEIYLCPEFQHWNGETGYRDPLRLRRNNMQ